MGPIPRVTLSRTRQTPCRNQNTVDLDKQSDSHKKDTDSRRQTKEIQETKIRISENPTIQGTLKRTMSTPLHLLINDIPPYRLVVLLYFLINCGKVPTYKSCIRMERFPMRPPVATARCAATRTHACMRNITNGERVYIRLYRHLQAYRPSSERLAPTTCTSLW
jgi:hypothetical protein